MNECLVRAISIVVLAAVLPGWAVSTCLAEAGTPRPAASADNHRPSLEARLAEAEAVLSERGAVLDRQLEEAQQRLRELEDAGEQAGPEREARKDLLDRRLAVIDGERALLQAAVIARREALEHWEAGDHAAQESTEFRARLAQGPISMGPAELAALEAELAQIASSVAQADQAITAASQRLETLAAPADSPDRSPTEQSLMEAERLAVLAQADAAAQHRLALQTQRELLEARLESARAVPPVTQPAAAATAADNRSGEQAAAGGAAGARGPGRAQ